MPNIRVSEQHYYLACIFFIKNYSHFCGCLWTTNSNKSILAVVCVLLGTVVRLQNKGEVVGIVLLLCLINF